MAKKKQKQIPREGCRGGIAADLLVVAAFTKAAQVLGCEALDALRFNAQSIKHLVGGACVKDNVLSLQRHFAFVPAKQ